MSNERLRQMMAEQFEFALSQTPEALANENAKLREMVADMMQAWWACDNERCPRHDKRCEEGKFCAFDECARDLGIEVDE